MGAGREYARLVFYHELKQAAFLQNCHEQVGRNMSLNARFDFYFLCFYVAYIQKGELSGILRSNTYLFVLKVNLFLLKVKFNLIVLKG